MFSHDLVRESDEKLCFRSDVEMVCLINGKLAVSEELDTAFKSYIDKE